MVFKNIPSFELGGKKISIVQGGMGVGISLGGLASAVVNEGGLGNIAAVGVSELDRSFYKNLRENEKEIERTPLEKRREIYDRIYAYSNKQSLKKLILETRAKCYGDGLLGVNVMSALTDSRSLVEGAIEAGADTISIGAGIFRNFPEHLRGTKTRIIPIINSARVAKFFCSNSDKLGYFPSAFIVEGPMAGGHLGYSFEQLADSDFVAHGLEKIIPEVVEAVKPYEDKFGRKIPVLFAGGVFYGGDITRYLELGGAGAQIATRTMTTGNCDASMGFKQTVLNCEKEDLGIIHSPVHMPGRVVRKGNNFLDRVERGEEIPYECPYHCLTTCDPTESPYCIARGLLNAREGNFEEGFPFAGSNAWRCKEDGIISIKELFSKLDREYAEGKRCE